MNNAKDVNDILRKGVDPLSVPLEDARGGDRAAETDLEGNRGPILRWKGADPDWWTETIPAREWLVVAGNTENAPGYIPRGEVGILAGRGATGKTWALVALALAVATGKEWLGYRTAPRGGRGRVALLVAEETGDEVRRRVRAQADMMDIRLADLAGRIVVLDRSDMVDGAALVTEETWQPTPFGLKVFASLRTEAKNGDWDLVVLDPLSAFGPPDCETDNAAATYTMRDMARPSRPTRLPSSSSRRP